MYRVVSNPDRKRICTSHREPKNLTMRMQMRRLTRLINAFSKKLNNLCAALCLHLAWYEFVEFTKMKILIAFLVFSTACLAQSAGLGSGCASGFLSSLGCSTTLPSGLTIGPVAGPFHVANPNG